MFSKKKTILLGFFLLVLLAIIYIHNLSLSVYGGDVGDLVTSSVVAGVAHPPGYPLFTLLGFLLTRIPFATPAFMVGLISAFSSVFAVAIFFLLSLRISKNKVIALIASLILAFNYLFWFYAEIAEVFALNNLFVLLLLFIALLYREKKHKNYLFLLSFVAGLSLTNHQTILLVFPSILILIYDSLFNLRKNPKVLIQSLIFFILGFSIYIYVPLASFRNPVINWDNVKDINSFLHLILRKDYGTISAGSFEPPNWTQRMIILKTYFADIFSQLTLPVVILSLLGFIKLFLKDKRLFFSLLMGFLISGPVFIGYAGFPLVNNFYVGVYERFFVMSSIILLLFFPAGLKLFIDFLNSLLKKKIYEPLFLGIFFLIPLALFYYNFPKTDLHNIHIGDRLAYDFLTPLPKNSLLLMSGDTILFNTWYVHYGLNFRPDVTIVNLDALGFDTFLRSEKAKYLIDHPKDKTNPDLFIYIFKEIAKNRPVFSLSAVQPIKGQKNIWIPYGLEFKMLSQTNNIPSEKDYVSKTDSVLSEFKKPSILETKSIALGSLSIADIPQTYSIAYLRIGNFMYSQYRDKNLAYAFFQKAIANDSNVYQNYDVMGAYYLYVDKSCSKAEQNLLEAKNIYPFDNYSYYLLYLTYRDCFKNNNKAKTLVKEYNDVFKSDFFTDVSKNKALLVE